MPSSLKNPLLYLITHFYPITNTLWLYNPLRIGCIQYKISSSHGCCTQIYYYPINVVLDVAAIGYITVHLCHYWCIRVKNHSKHCMHNLCLEPVYLNCTWHVLQKKKGMAGLKVCSENHTHLVKHIHSQLPVGILTPSCLLYKQANTPYIWTFFS